MQPDRCPVCDVRSVPFDALDVSVRDAPVWSCRTCQAVFLHPVAEVEYEDSDWSHMRKERWATDTDRARRFAPRLLRAAEQILGRPVRRVVEVGCGSGYMGAGFIAAGVTYTGLDVDESSLAWAREHGIDVQAVPAERLHDWLGEHAPYDLLISSNTYEHVRSPDAAFAALARSGIGLVAIIVPNPDGLVARAKAMPRLRQLATRLSGNRPTAFTLDGTWHTLAYRAGTFRVLCARHGLDVLDLHTVAVNDPTWGFAQPNTRTRYRVIASIEAAVERQTQLLLLARPPRPDAEASA